MQGEGNCATVERLYRHLTSKTPELNKTYGKQIQNPYLKAEPPYKMYYILLPRSANINDIISLKNAALNAEVNYDFELAKKLWIRVLAVDGTDNDAVLGIERIAATLATDQQRESEKKTPTGQNKNKNPEETQPKSTGNTSGDTIQSSKPAKRGFLKTAGITTGGLILALMIQQIFGNQQPIKESTDPQPTKTSYNPNPSESNPINIDRRYTKLETLLKAQDFRAADQETDKVMLAVAKREKEGYLIIEDVEKFPCKELRSIDKLWLKYSGGKFGISVQQQIYQSLGGTKEYNQKVWESMGDRVGWRQGVQWLSYSNLNFSQKAQSGHLPWTLRDGVPIRFFPSCPDMQSVTHKNFQRS